MVFLLTLPVVSVADRAKLLAIMNKDSLSQKLRLPMNLSLILKNMSNTDAPMQRLIQWFNVMIFQGKTTLYLKKCSVITAWNLHASPLVLLTHIQRHQKEQLYTILMFALAAGPV